jgi:HlyD family secretion protein
VDRKITRVWRLDHEQAQAVTVSTGIADSLFTEITDGQLQEGDSVIVGIESPEEQSQKKLPPGFDAGPRMR